MTRAQFEQINIAEAAFDLRGVAIKHTVIE